MVSSSCTQSERGEEGGERDGVHAWVAVVNAEGEGEGTHRPWQERTHCTAGLHHRIFEKDQRATRSSSPLSSRTGTQESEEIGRFRQKYGQRCQKQLNEKKSKTGRSNNRSSTVQEG